MARLGEGFFLRKETVGGPIRIRMRGLMNGYVYVLTDGTAFKIGYTSDRPIVRQWGCQVGNPIQLTLVLTIQSNEPDVLERELHRRYWHRKALPHKQTGEWFNLTPEDLKEIQENYHVKKPYDPISPGGHSPFDVRPVPRGQQDQAPGRREDVPGRASPFDDPNDQPVFDAGGRKY
jgi:hypothetical protein